MHRYQLTAEEVLQAAGALQARREQAEEAIAGIEEIDGPEWMIERLENGREADQEILEILGADEINGGVSIELNDGHLDQLLGALERDWPGADQDLDEDLIEKLMAPWATTEEAGAP